MDNESCLVTYASLLYMGAVSMATDGQKHHAGISLKSTPIEKVSDLARFAPPEARQEVLDTVIMNEIMWYSTELILFVETILLDEG